LKVESSRWCTYDTDFIPNRTDVRFNAWSSSLGSQRTVVSLKTGKLKVLKQLKQNMDWSETSNNLNLCGGIGKDRQWHTEYFLKQPINQRVDAR